QMLNDKRVITVGRWGEIDTWTGVGVARRRLPALGVLEHQVNLARRIVFRRLGVDQVALAFFESEDVVIDVSLFEKTPTDASRQGGDLGRLGGLVVRLLLDDFRRIAEADRDRPAVQATGSAWGNPDRI